MVLDCHHHLRIISSSEDDDEICEIRRYNPDAFYYGSILMCYLQFGLHVFFYAKCTVRTLRTSSVRLHPRSKFGILVSRKTCSIYLFSSTLSVRLETWSTCLILENPHACSKFGVLVSRKNYDIVQKLLSRFSGFREVANQEAWADCSTRAIRISSALGFAPRTLVNNIWM